VQPLTHLVAWIKLDLTFTFNSLLIRRIPFHGDADKEGIVLRLSVCLSVSVSSQLKKTAELIFT